MKVSVLLVVTALAIDQSQGLFFRPPSSECRSDSQCPSFRNGRYPAPGKCVTQRRGILCPVFRPNDSCTYRMCAECLETFDCRGFDQYCENNRCRSRYRPPPSTTPRYG
eukprot:TRINITY_DN10220_c0_g1_i1.p1 TRINITY_DN10220_c0_g1~~TRINITY_DN10220_c0_g1_i1.p1  ORF type:complete len:109 (+),score=4.32 TRINITY_DN10220_c0_g1_i1:99-425(+)